MHRQPIRRLLLRACAVALLSCGAVAIAPAVWPGQAAYAQGARDAQAEQFVTVEGQKVLSILSDRNRSRSDETNAFRALVDEIVDVPRVTNFVLGKYARTITPAQRQRFATVFRQFAQNVYESRLGDYRGEKIKVNGSVVRKPGDVIVNTSVFGGQLSQPVPVSWRLAGGGTSWKIVDVQVKGVWLAITQQQDFVSTIDNAGGNVDVLINQLQTKVQADKAAPKR